MSAPKYRLRLLGSPALEREGQPLSQWPAQRKPLALLALLAVAGDRGATRDRLLAYLWPESEQSRARGALSQVLSRLRREIGDGVIATEADVRLDPAIVSSDVAEYGAAVAARDWSAAAKLYDGVFLDGFYVKDTPEFEQWVDEHRRRLASSYAKALEQLATAAHERGSYAEAVRWWELRAARDLTNGRVARSYMNALAAAGDPGAALRHAEIYAALVRSELGVEPDAAVLDLAAQLRRAPEAPLLAQPAMTRTLNAAPSVWVPPDATTDSRWRRPILSRASFVGVLGVLGLLSGMTWWALAVPFAATEAGLGAVAITPFVNLTGDSAADAFSDMLRRRTSEQLAGIGLVRVAHDSQQQNAEFQVEATLRYDHDSLMVLVTVTRRGATGQRRELNPLSVHRAQRPELVDRVFQHVAGAVAALADPRVNELAWSTTLPRYDAYLAYIRGTEEAVHATGAPEAHWSRAADLDTAFVAPRAMRLVMEGGSDRDSLFEWFESRRVRLSRTDQLLYQATRARVEQRVDDYYTSAALLHALAPTLPTSRWHTANAAQWSRRYDEAIAALHALRREPAWLGELWSTWQADLDAHHMLGDFRVALAEWQEVRRHGLDFTTCTYGVRQLAALGRDTAVDSLIGACTSRDVVADRTRLDGRVQLADELYRVAGRELLWHGHLDAGRRVLQRAFEIAQGMFRTDSTANNGWLAAQLMQDWPRAYALMQADLARMGPCGVRDRRLLCSPRGRTRLAVTAVRAGDTTVGPETLAWIASRPGHDPMLKLESAKILLAMGRRDEAIRALRLAAQALPPEVFHYNTDLLELREDERFLALTAPRRD